MGRSDDMAKAFRGELGLDNTEAPYGMDAQASVDPGFEPDGLRIADVDVLLRRREHEAYWRGRHEGEQSMREIMDRQRAAEIGQYVGAAFSLVESDVLSAVVLSAVKARDSRATKAELVQAVVDAVKREGASLGEMAHRARTGELFS